MRSTSGSFPGPWAASSWKSRTAAVRGRSASGTRPLPRLRRRSSRAAGGVIRAGFGSSRLERGRGLLLRLHDPGDAEKLVPLGEREELDALRAAPGLPDLAHAGADALALGREQHDLAAVADAERPGDVDRAVLGQVDRDDAGAAAADEPVVLEGSPLSDPVLAGDEQPVLRVAHLDRLHMVAADLEPHPGDPDGVAALFAKVILAEADRLALVADEHDLVLPGREDASDQGVALLELDAAEAALAGGVRVVGEVRLLGDPGLRRHDDMERAREVLHAEHGRDLLPLGQPQEARDRLALGGAGPLGHVVDLLGVALPRVREEQDVVVGARREQVLDEILVVCLRPDDALAAAPLGAVVGDSCALDEPQVRDRDDAALVRDHV